MNEEINKLIDSLENFDGMFGCLLSKVESNLLVSYIKQLQHNWNELKKYIEEQKNYLTKITGQHIPLNDSFEFCSMNELYQTGKYSGLKDTLIKMQELEEGGNNE